jgi:hypothetical protein
MAAAASDPESEEALAFIDGDFELPPRSTSRAS